jgi:hypothetical protein
MPPRPRVHRALSAYWHQCGRKVVIGQGFVGIGRVRGDARSCSGVCSRYDLPLPVEDHYRIIAYEHEGVTRAAALAIPVHNLGLLDHRS